MKIAGAIQALRAHQPLPNNPWAYFLLFLVSNCFLSYGNLSLQLVIWIFLFGLCLPFVALLITPSRMPPFVLHQKDFIEAIPIWFWLLIYGAALFARIGQMTFWAHWPDGDSSLLSFFSLELSQKWSWPLFLSHAQNPAPFYWGLALIYKLFNPSLFTTRFYSIVISGLIVAITYSSARTCFPRSLSLFCLMVTATGFWTLYAGDLCFFHVLALLWQIAALGFLGRLIHSPVQ